LRAGLFSCRAAADDDQIEIFAKNQHNLPLRPDTTFLAICL
jgi:hypothetical protein